MAEKILNVEPNASLSDVKRAYHLKIKELDGSSDDFKELFDRYTDAYNDITFRKLDKTDAGCLHRDSITPFSHFSLFPSDSFTDRFFSMRPFDAFSHLHNRVSKLMNGFRSDFESDSKLDDLDVEKDMETIPEEPTTDSDRYCKYVSSYTTYNNGKRFSKTSSRVERVKNGKKRVSHITKTQDGDKITIDKHNNNRLTDGDFYSDVVKMQ